MSIEITRKAIPKQVKKDMPKIPFVVEDGGTLYMVIMDKKGVFKTIDLESGQLLDYNYSSLRDVVYNNSEFVIEHFKVSLDEKYDSEDYL